MKKVLVIFAVAVILRIWHLPETAQFSYDEARDAAAEKLILEGNLTLLGPESQIGDKRIYFGPLHYYLMAPALALSNFDPMGPYFLTAIIGGLTAVLLAKYFSPAAGLFYAVFPIAVIYNRWAWNPNTIPFFIVISLIFYSKKRLFFAGLFAGLVTQLHWMAGAFVLFYIFKPKALLGVIAGLLPVIIFDLRSNFLYTRTLLDLFNGPVARTLNWHYFLWLIPIVAINFPRKIVIAGSLLITAIWLYQLKPNLPLNPFYVRQMAKIIALDQTDPNLTYNVVSFYGGDFRAHNMRYFLDFEINKPLGPSEYSVADHLYAVTFEDEDKVLYNGLYELESFGPKRVSNTWELAGARIYRLEKL